MPSSPSGGPRHHCGGGGLWRQSAGALPWREEPICPLLWFIECSGWWFGTWLLFVHSVGNNHPNWLILFRGVQRGCMFICWAAIWGYEFLRSCGTFCKRLLQFLGSAICLDLFQEYWSLCVCVCVCVVFFLRMIGCSQDNLTHRNWPFVAF